MKSGSITHSLTITPHPIFIKHIISTFRKAWVAPKQHLNLTYGNKLKSNIIFAVLESKTT